MPVLINHNEGVSRLIPPNTKKGQWRFGFICPKCKEQIPVLDNNDPPITEGRIAIGKGKFSCPCPSCATDEILFGTEDLIPIQAAKDFVVSPAMPRRKPSNSARQVAYRRYPKAKATFGVRFVEDRPECAVIIARCVTGWSYVEENLALLLASILQINTKPAVAMFLAINNAATQATVIGAAAEAVLSTDDLKLFEAMMVVHKRIGDQRNDLVHGLFGGSFNVKEGLLWSEKKHRAAHTAAIWANEKPLGDSKFREEVFVYEPADLETIADSIGWLYQFIGWFRGYISSDNARWRAQRYRQLCSEPRISEVLARPRKK
jgi:hypothetical protein